MTWYKRRGKRVLDLSLATTGTLATLPLHLLCLIAIALTDGRPVYFLQERAGLNGRPFKIIKFRTMTIGTDENFGGYPAPSAVTPVGRLLRRTSLDELPQLFNVIRGDMSLVGPRPALVSQAVRYNEEQMKRLNVRPGITGLAQVQGRNSAPWSKRIEADATYVENQSLELDLRIMALTVPAAVFGSGQEIGQTADHVDDLSPARLAPPNWPYSQ